jgi:hypothetical protein
MGMWWLMQCGCGGSKGCVVTHWGCGGSVGPHIPMGMWLFRGDVVTQCSVGDLMAEWGCGCSVGDEVTHFGDVVAQSANCLSYTRLQQQFRVRSVSILSSFTSKP